MSEQPTRIIVKPSRSIFGGRRQWRFEVRAANGRRMSDRDTYANRSEASEWWEEFLTGDGPVELVVQDRYGNVEQRRRLR